jgi:hypothetical protein
VAHLFKNSIKDSLAVPDEANHDFYRRSLDLEFVLPRPPYDPDLASPDFHLFGRLKGALQGRRITDDEELQHSFREKLRRFSKEFYTSEIKCLTQSCEEYVDIERRFVGKSYQL